jgi:ribonucleotide monophosphatase NagD (HAD superfamily)
VGDTPESDIRGMNQFNAESKNEWYSIQVRTGVFKEGTQPTCKPMATVETVLDAVKHGMKREFNKKMKVATMNLAMQSSLRHPNRRL